MNAKKHIYLKALFIAALIMLLSGPASAITISANPANPDTNQPVTITIGAVFRERPACSLEVNFGDSQNWTPVGACYSSPCIKVVTHAYTSPGMHTISARSQSGTCLYPPVGPNPASYTINVQAACNPLILITPSQLPPGTTGQPYSLQFNHSGGFEPVSFTPVGSLPPGLSMGSSGLLSGVPTVTGTGKFTVQVVDSCPNGRQTVRGVFSLTIAQPCDPLSITTPSPLRPGTTGKPYSFQFSHSGGYEPVSFILAGSLPPGLSLGSSGLLSGVPKTSGTSTFTVQAMDSCAFGIQTDKRVYSLTIAQPCDPLSITTPPSLPQGTKGQPYLLQFNHSGGYEPVSFTPAGSLPPGLTLGSSGLLSGTPMAQGTYSFTVQTRDTCPSGSQTEKKVFSLSIAQSCDPLSITTQSTLPPCITGRNYQVQLISAGGFGAISYQILSGSLPQGLTLNSSGLISGIPASNGTSVVVIGSRDSCPDGNQTAQKQFSITSQTQCSPISITTPSSLATGKTGIVYQMQLSISGGMPPVNYSVVTGYLPQGMGLSQSGLISGIPAQGGTFTITIRVEDSCPGGVQSDQRTFNLVVDQSQDMNLAATPATFIIGKDTPSTQRVTFTASSSAPANRTLTSSLGTFMAGNTVIGQQAAPLTLTMTNGYGNVSENVAIPIAIIKRARNAGTSRIIYKRDFRDQAVSASAQSVIIITTDAGAAFRINSVRLYFENNRPEITIQKNQPLPKLCIEVMHTGAGLIQGFWEVDGKLFSTVTRQIANTGREIICAPVSPTFPTFNPGTHIVRFVITSPENSMDFPEAVYYVLTSENQNITSIQLVLPADTSQVEFGPADFRWNDGNPVKSTAYLIEFLPMTGEKPVFSAYTKKMAYQIPVPVLKQVFVPGREYQWRVTGYGDDNEIQALSSTFKFRFADPRAYVQHEIIVALDNQENAPALIKDLAGKYGLEILETFELKATNIRIAILYSSGDIFPVIQALKTEKDILETQPNHIFRTMGDPLSDMQGMIKSLNLGRVHHFFTGKGVKVAVIDTGVDFDHDDLKDRNAGSGNFIKDSPYRGEIHGTAVAGLIAASINGFGIEGVAPEAKIVCLRACRQLEEGKPEGECYTGSILKSIDAAIEGNAKIINMSFGAVAADPLISSLIKKGDSMGILFVAPAGNAPDQEEPGFPANLPEVISVAGSDTDGQPYPNRALGQSATASAPAVNLLTCVPGNGHNFVSGTSFSSAIVSGILAMSVEKNGNSAMDRLPDFNGDLCKWMEKALGISVCN
ncbi:MAG: putative Ig domain-containing protein [Pseudomonadota bacterium]